VVQDCGRRLLARTGEQLTEEVAAAVEGDVVLELRQREDVGFESARAKAVTYRSGFVADREGVEHDGHDPAGGRGAGGRQCG
jgi:hypothetical protein